MVIHPYICRLRSEHARIRTIQANVMDTFCVAACLQGGTGEKKPGEGYESHKARRVRLEHEAMAYVLHDWDERTANKKKVFWEGKIERDTKVYIGAVVMDHPQLDKFTAGSRI